MAKQILRCAQDDSHPPVMVPPVMLSAAKHPVVVKDAVAKHPVVAKRLVIAKRLVVA
jgi:hypothetical protein